MKLAPFQLSPIFMPRIWGSRDLQPLFDLSEPRDHRPLQNTEPIGEVWFTGESCRVASGSLAGRSLGEIWRALPQEFTGSRVFGTPRIPLLVKFIFPEDKLSVQVHPDDDYARVHEAASGGTGKTEMWYAVSARNKPLLGLGLEPGVTREGFQEAIADGTVEDCLKQFEVHAGDAFFVPAGTAHMIGPGVVLCEVQEHSDLTYRVFDYNRLQADGKPRPLHVRQALDVTNFGEQAGGLADPVRVQRGPLSAAYLTVCRHFVVERWDFTERIGAATSPETFELLVTLNGHGKMEYGGESFPYGPAEVWLLPASLGDYHITPESEIGSAGKPATVLLRSYVPDIEKFAQALVTEGIPEATVSRLVHR